MSYRLLAIIIFSALCGSGLTHLYASAQMSKVLLAHAEEKRQLAEHSQKAIEQVRVEEQAKAVQVRELSNAERPKVKARSTVATQLDSVVARVRDLAASDPDQGDQTPGASSGSRGETVTEASVVRTQLYRSVDAEAVELGKAFDEAYARGVTCERQYEILTE